MLVQLRVPVFRVDEQDVVMCEVQEPVGGEVNGVDASGCAPSVEVDPDGSPSDPVEDGVDGPV